MLSRPIQDPRGINDAGVFAVHMRERERGHARGFEQPSVQGFLVEGEAAVADDEELEANNAEAGRGSGGGMSSSGQILPGRGAERAAEHGGEGAGAAVAEALCDPRHGLALGEPPQ